MKRTVFSLLLTFLFAQASSAGTQVSFWHSFTNEVSGEVHSAFHLENSKHGLFFGPCGPSTESLQWEYGFELKGKNSQYTKDSIELKNFDFEVLPVDSGSISVDEKKSTIHIAIKINTNGVPQDFIGNGTYKLRSKL